MAENTNVIHRIKMGFVNAWLYGSPGHWLLIDAGTRITMPSFFSQLAALECEPAHIALLVVSHVHYDHVGGIGRLRKQAPVPVAVHAAEADILETARFVISDGLNLVACVKAFAARHLMNKAFVAFDPVVPDVVVEGEMRLDAYGFDAAIVPTPGHSDGSISVLTDGGALFSGDTAVNLPYRGIWQHMSHYGKPKDAILQTWRMLLERNVRHVYPGHGEDFPASVLAAILERGI